MNIITVLGILLLSVGVLSKQVDRVTPAFTSPKSGTKFSFGTHIGARLVNNLINWELSVPTANPGFLQMFYDRDKVPARIGMTPWQGEFIGKYLCAAINSWKILRDDVQEKNLHMIVQSFLKSQAPDGYLGTFSQSARLRGSANWDCWSHSWAIRALLMYYKEFNSPSALQAAIKAADLIINTYVTPNIAMTNDGNWGQSNYAIIHGFALLFEVTADNKYLDAAKWVIQKWDEPGGGLYMMLAKQGKEMYEFVGNRWESMHDFIGLFETYMITGNQTYLDALKDIYYSILKGDRHPTGGFSSGEHTTGDPFHDGSIETCATVAWQDLTIHLLRLTGNPLIADEIELTFWNAIVGSQSRFGDWWTYDTPIIGNRLSTSMSIGSQAGPGGPYLSCCSVNGPRGLSLIAEWAYMLTGDGSGVVINYYGPSTITLQIAAAQLTLTQITEYPRTGAITVKVGLPTPTNFTLHLRVPSWSSNTTLRLNGEPVQNAQAGTYFQIDRQWNDGDQIQLNLDMSFHYWAGERELFGSSILYYGPLLLAYEETYNTLGGPRVLDSLNVKYELVPSGNYTIPPIAMLSVQSPGTDPEYLVDFATAGAYGNFYTSIFSIANVNIVPFNASWPIWINRPHK
jgi:DUF1680 family protein